MRGRFDILDSYENERPGYPDCVNEALENFAWHTPPAPELEEELWREIRSFFERTGVVEAQVTLQRGIAHITQNEIKTRIRGGMGVVPDPAARAIIEELRKILPRDSGNRKIMP